MIIVYIYKRRQIQIYLLLKVAVRDLYESFLFTISGTSIIIRYIPKIYTFLMISNKANYERLC